MLTAQYRMNASIMQWSSDELYEGRLTAHDSVASHTLGTLEASDAAGPSGRGREKAGKAPKGGKAAKGGGKAAGDGAAAGGGGAAAGAAGSLPVLLLIDTAGCGFDERMEEEGDSKSNPGEAKVQPGALLVASFRISSWLGHAAYLSARFLTKFEQLCNKHLPVKLQPPYHLSSLLPVAVRRPSWRTFAG